MKFSSRGAVLGTVVGVAVGSLLFRGAWTRELLALLVGVVLGSVATIVSFAYYAVLDDRRRSVSLHFEAREAREDGEATVVDVHGHVLGEDVVGALDDDDRAALGMIVMKVRNGWNRTK